MIHLLILEDDPQLCDILRFYLKEKSDYRLFFAESAEAALELLETTRFDIMLLDVMQDQGKEAQGLIDRAFEIVKEGQA